MTKQSYKLAADRIRTGNAQHMDEAICDAWEKIFRPVGKKNTGYGEKVWAWANGRVV